MHGQGVNMWFWSAHEFEIKHLGSTSKTGYLRLGVFVSFSAPLDAAVCGDDDGDLLGRGLFDLKAFSVEARVQGLQADQVFEF